MRVNFPIAYRDLFKPSRYKVFYGGRGGAKSHNIAQYLVVSMLQEPRACVYGCYREIGESLQDSVKSLLMHYIDKYNVSDQFHTATTLRKIICKRNGAYFLLGGLANERQVNKVKSQPFLKKAWLEEAEKTKEDFWDIITPSVRDDETGGCEILVSFNPNKKNDFIYQRFVVDKPPPGSLVKKVNYYDNPYFPPVLEYERQACLQYPYKYRRIWLGEAGFFERQLLKTHWWKYYDRLEDILPTLTGMYISEDTAYKEEDAHDFSVLQLWGYSGSQRIYLLGQIRGRWDFSTLLRKNQEFVDWACALDRIVKPDRIYIEDKASGTSLIQTLRRNYGIAAVDWRPKDFGFPNDKVGRVNQASLELAAGMVYLPRHAKWLYTFLDECSDFGEEGSEGKKDQVDTFGIGMSIWRSRGGGIQIKGN